MRINPDENGQLMYALSVIGRAQAKAMQEVSSGRRFSTPSEDPAGMSLLIKNQSRAERNSEYLDNVANLKSVLQVGDSALGSVVSGLQRAISLGTEGASGTLSQADRDALSQEVKGIQENILQLGNTSFKGLYLFSGTETQKQPFTEDSSAVPAVTYNGNAQIREVTVAENRNIAGNVPGSEIFASEEGNVFAALRYLRVGLESGDVDQVAAATDQVKAAFDTVTSKRVYFGNTLSELDDVEGGLNKQKVSIAEEESRIGDADMASSISDLLNAETARNATLAAAGQISRTSLLDYLG